MAAGSAPLARHLERAWLRRGALARVLWPLACLHAVLLQLRRAWYRLRPAQIIHVDVPVIVVGNLVAGGAGKTPTVLAVLALLRRQGWQPGVISRGYGRQRDDVLEVGADSSAAQCGDEPLLLQRRAQVPVYVGRDRVAAARALRQRHPAVDVIVSDDGLQHWRLARTAQVIVFDERGLGNGWLLPAGPLREPFAVQPPPRSVVLYNAPAPSTRWPGSLARRGIAALVPLNDWWRGSDERAQPLSAWRGRPVRAVAGVARPQRFFAMLREAGLEVDEFALPDHYDYATLPWPEDALDIVLTEKDAVKLPPGRVGAARVWVAALDFALDPAAQSALLSLLPERP